MVLASRRLAVRRAPVWYGGLAQDPGRVSTTALTFSNALRTFYSFVYRPTEETRREAKGTHFTSCLAWCFRTTWRRFSGPICFDR